jgi:hypothetical protein
VIYDGRRQGLVEWEGHNQPEIELNDASDRSHGRMAPDLPAGQDRMNFCIVSISSLKSIGF